LILEKVQRGYRYVLNGDQLTPQSLSRMWYEDI